MTYEDAIKLVSGDDWRSYLEDDDDGKLGFTLFSMAVNPIPDYWYTNGDTSQGFSSAYTDIITAGDEEAIQPEQSRAIRYFLTDDTGVDFRVSFSDVSNIEFKEQNAPTDEVGEIFIWNADRTPPSSLGYTIWPGYAGVAGDIVFDNSLNPDDSLPGSHADINYNQSGYGEKGFLVILHELGHAVAGLEHPEAQYDNHKYTIMADTIGDTHSGMHHSVLPTGLQLFDIASTQEIYGRNFNTRNYDTEYKAGNGFGEAGADGDTAFIYTIWDGGGGDVVDASAYDEWVHIDLRQGAFSSIGEDGNNGRAIDNVAIAYYTVIENATGTNHGDILIGNAWNNVLRGEEGNDHLYGDGVVKDGDVGFGTDRSDLDTYTVPDGLSADDGSGDDTLNPGLGADLAYGGYGNDTFTAAGLLDGLEGDLYHGGGYIGGPDGGVEIAHNLDGLDTVDYSALGYGLKINIADPANGTGQRWDSSTNTVSGGIDTLISIEGIIGTAHDDHVTVLSSASPVDGGGGRDVLTNTATTRIQHNNPIVVGANLSNPGDENTDVYGFEEIQHSKETYGYYKINELGTKFHLDWNAFNPNDPGQVEYFGDFTNYSTLSYKGYDSALTYRFYLNEFDQQGQGHVYHEITDALGNKDTIVTPEYGQYASSAIIVGTDHGDTFLWQDPETLEGFGGGGAGPSAPILMDQATTFFGVICPRMMAAMLFFPRRSCTVVATILC